MKSNENHIRHIVKSEFMNLFQHEMGKISISLGKEIINNKLKIADVENKLSLLFNLLKNLLMIQRMRKEI